MCLLGRSELGIYGIIPYLNDKEKPGGGIAPFLFGADMAK